MLIQILFTHPYFVKHKNAETIRTDAGLGGCFRLLWRLLYSYLESILEILSGNYAEPTSPHFCGATLVLRV